MLTVALTNIHFLINAMLTNTNACISAVSQRILMPLERLHSGIKALPVLTTATPNTQDRPRYRPRKHASQPAKYLYYPVADMSINVAAPPPFKFIYVFFN